MQATIHAELVTRYRMALRGWAYILATLGRESVLMGKRAYCNAYVSEYGPLTWADDGTTLLLLSPDAAYTEALALEGTDG